MSAWHTEIHIIEQKKALLPIVDFQTDVSRFKHIVNSNDLILAKSTAPCKLKILVERENQPYELA